jgi:hypothetical protein
MSFNYTIDDTNEIHYGILLLVDSCTSGFETLDCIHGSVDECCSKIKQLAITVGNKQQIYKRHFGKPS